MIVELDDGFLLTQHYIVFKSKLGFQRNLLTSQPKIKKQILNKQNAKINYEKIKY